MEKTFAFDSTDLKGMRKLMKKYGDSHTMFKGKNDKFEDVDISIFPDMIVYTTYQSNGWKRENIYYYEGSVEETFVGRWG